jgi:hypothetical protein
MMMISRNGQSREILSAAAWPRPEAFAFGWEATEEVPSAGPGTGPLGEFAFGMFCI